MAIPESFLQELVEKNDIVDVVGEYVRLTKRSGSNQFGLCPFHSEKTPSFSVSPDRHSDAQRRYAEKSLKRVCAVCLLSVRP